MNPKHKCNLFMRYYTYGALGINFIASSLILALAEDNYKILFVGVIGAIILNVRGLLTISKDKALKDFSTGTNIVRIVAAIIISICLSVYLLIFISMMMSMVIFALIFLEIIFGSFWYRTQSGKR